jgi:hypothetical protein
MCRGKKREAKDYVGGIRWGSVEALSLGFRWAVAPLICKMFLYWCTFFSKMWSLC